MTFWRLGDGGAHAVLRTETAPRCHWLPFDVLVTRITWFSPPPSLSQTPQFMRFRPILIPLGIIGLCALAIAYAVHTPDARGLTAPVTEFSAERAMAHVRQLARAPRPPGSDGHREAMVYIMARIAAMGVEPRIQGTTGIGTRYPVAGQVRNILARIPGTRPTTRRGRGAVLLMAHYDGVAAGPAAGDDASGVAVLLETLRAIRQGPLLANDVIALFTDSEESGLLGAAAFAREHAWTADVGVILNFEARGTHGPSLMFETGSANHDVIRFLRTVRGARATSLSTAVYRQLPNDTDLSELAVLGRPAMNFGFIAGVERYHTSEDDVAHLSPESIQHHGDQALALTRAFGNARLPRPGTAGEGGQGDAVFFDLPLVGIVLYPESWALPFALLALIAGIVAFGLDARRERAAWLAAGFGVATMVVSVVVAALLAAGAAWLLARLHASLPWGGTPQWRGIYALAIALLTVAIITSAMALARGVSRGQTRAVDRGAIVALGALSVYVTAAMPGVSFLFTWPVFAAAAAGIVAAVSPPAITSVVRWIATAFIVCLLAPTTYLMVCVALGLDLTGAAVLAILTAFGVWLLASHLEGASNRWRVPLGAAAAALVAIAIGVFTVRSDAAWPAGSAFVYAADSASAWLTGSATNAWARDWVQRELVSRADSRRDVIPPWLMRSLGSRRIVSAPLVAVPAPSAGVVGATMAGNERIVTVRIMAPGARSVQVSAETGVVARARVDDREIGRDGYRGRSQRWSLDYIAPPDSGFTLTLALHRGTDHALSLVARYPGFPSGVQLPTRPAGIIPIGAGDATHVFRLVSLR